MKRLTEPRNTFGFSNVWTQDRKSIGSNIFVFDQLCAGEATGRCSLKTADPSCFY